MFLGLIQVPEDTKSVIVTVADNALSDIHNLAKRLASCGMTVRRVLPTTGVISGSVSASRVSELRSESGVESVEEELRAYPSHK